MLSTTSRVFVLQRTACCAARRKLCDADTDAVSLRSAGLEGRNAAGAEPPAGGGL